MRHRYIGGAVLAAVIAVGWPAAAAAQEGGFPPPVNGDGLPIPTGSSGQPGFYTSVEFVMLTQTRALGNQSIAVRGFFDATGNITGLPGTFVGTGADALNTQKMGPREFSPGYRVEVGYKFDTGVRIYGSFMQISDVHYTAGATQVPLGFSRRADLADTFLSAPVYNFPPAFGGAQFDTAFDTSQNGGFNTFGIWNAADVMDTKFLQRYTQADIGARTPLFATDYSSVYGLAGGRFAWFFERYTWRTVDIDTGGNAPPQSVAIYSNTLSQRMYGLFVGCGHEVYLGNMFSASLDLTAAALLNVVKERAKYELGDLSTQSKFGRVNYSVVPSGTAEFNLWFYPIEGVQIRLGYMGLTYFNTRYMREPVGYNFGEIDPNYGTKWFRLVHGFNVGVGFFF
jgi:hypothetical protein